MVVNDHTTGGSYAVQHIWQCLFCGVTVLAILSQQSETCGLDITLQKKCYTDRFDRLIDR